MVDPVAVVVWYLSHRCVALKDALESLSPSDGSYNVLDHIQGGNDLPVGWRVDEQGPVIMVSLQGGDFALEDMPLINARITTQCHAALDSEASQVAYLLANALHEKSGPGFTYARADAPPQVIPDRTSEWRVGVTYYTVRVRNTA